MKNWFLPATLLGLSGVALVFASEKGRERVRHFLDDLMEHGDPLSEFNKFCEDQLETIQSEITEGTSALMVVTDEGNLDRVGERFHGMHSKLIDSNLTGPERELLLETFGGR